MNKTPLTYSTSLTTSHRVR